jgi:hypothetical protein
MPWICSVATIHIAASSGVDTRAKLVDRRGHGVGLIIEQQFHADIFDADHVDLGALVGEEALLLGHEQRAVADPDRVGDDQRLGVGHEATGDRQRHGDTGDRELVESHGWNPGGVQKTRSGSEWPGDRGPHYAIRNTYHGREGPDIYPCSSPPIHPAGSRGAKASPIDAANGGWAGRA